MTQAQTPTEQPVEEERINIANGFWLRVERHDTLAHPFVTLCDDNGSELLAGEIVDPAEFAAALIKTAAPEADDIEAAARAILAVADAAGEIMSVDLSLRYAKAALTKAAAPGADELDRLKRQRSSVLRALDDMAVLESRGALPNGHIAALASAVRGFCKEEPVAAPEDDLLSLLKEVVEKGLIYWEPQTSRGYSAKADLVARCEKVIDRAFETTLSRPAAAAPAGDVEAVEALVKAEAQYQLARHLWAKAIPDIEKSYLVECNLDRDAARTALLTCIADLRAAIVQYEADKERGHKYRDKLLVTIARLEAERDSGGAAETKAAAQREADRWQVKYSHSGGTGREYIVFRKDKNAFDAVSSHATVEEAYEAMRAETWKAVLALTHHPSASAVAVPDEWQPIETAPKDGTSILAAHEYYASDAWWSADDDGWIDGTTDGYDDRVVLDPTHWRPLPALPIQTPTGKAGSQEGGDHG